jgi:hypothetical protein
MFICSFRNSFAGRHTHARTFMMYLENVWYSEYWIVMEAFVCFLLFCTIYLERRSFRNVLRNVQCFNPAELFEN